jgi:hypothetical protein
MSSKRVNFRGALSETFDKTYRLAGDWEVAVVNLTLDKSLAVFIFCDLVGFSHINTDQMQFLDYYSPNTIRKNCPQYVKVVKKRFNSININFDFNDADVLLVSDSSAAGLKDIVCVLHFRKV